MRLDISRTVTAFSLTVLICLAGVIGIGAAALDALRIGGAAYEQIIAGKDLVADILPPPLYVVEAYLEVHLARSEPERLAQHVEKLAALRKDYDARHAFWRDFALPPEMAQTKDALVMKSDREAQRFFEEIEQRYLPALERHDAAATTTSYRRLAEAYAAHRAIIDDIVVQANAFVARAEQNAASSTRFFMALIAASSTLAVAIVGFVIYVMRAQIAAPLGQLSRYMRALSDTNFETRIGFQQRNDEIGDMARAVERFRAAIEERVELRRQRIETERRDKAGQEEENARRAAADAERIDVIERLGAALGRMSAGDLMARIAAPFPAEFERLRDAFNSSARRLQETLTEVVEGVGSMSRSTQSIASAADDLAGRTEQQIANLEETTAAVKEISVAVAETAEGASRAHRLVSSAKDEAQKNGEIVRKAVEAMSRIERSSTSIGQIIGAIDEIAFQTNLLALNAGVEAARAGEAGRGFAVVASEVRALAQRTATSAKEIEHLIDEAGVEVAEGVQLVTATGHALDQIAAQVAEINKVVSTIAARAAEQSAALTHVNIAIGQSDQDTQKNAAMVEETNAVSRSLQHDAETLAQSVGRFRIYEEESGGAWRTRAA